MRQPKDLIATLEQGLSLGSVRSYTDGTEQLIEATTVIREGLKTLIGRTVDIEMTNDETLKFALLLIGTLPLAYLGAPGQEKQRQMLVRVMESVRREVDRQQQANTETEFPVILSL